MMPVVLVTVQKGEEWFRICEFADLRLVETLAKFASHGVDHNLGQRVLSGVLSYLGCIQLDASQNMVGLNVRLMLFHLLQLEACVGVLPEKTHAPLLEMPDMWTCGELQGDCWDSLHLWLYTHLCMCRMV